MESNQYISIFLHGWLLWIAAAAWRGKLSAILVCLPFDELLVRWLAASTICSGLPTI
jgi:hypothetical protein